jgi:hypothetical protein
MAYRNPTSSVASLVVGVMACTICGCGKQSETDKHAAASKMSFGSSQWNNAAAEDISVRIVAVLQRPAAQLGWINEHNLPQRTREEKEVIATNGVTGQLEVVYSTGRGSGSREVRVVIIQTSPLTSDVKLPVPESGSSIYIQDGGTLKPLLTNSVASSLTLEIYQQKRETVFFMDYPRDRVRSGGAVFWWDENGKWHEL